MATYTKYINTIKGQGQSTTPYKKYTGIISTYQKPKQVQTTPIEPVKPSLFKKISSSIESKIPGGYAGAGQRIKEAFKKGEFNPLTATDSVASTFRKYVSDTFKTGTETAKSVVKLTPQYKALKASQGQPVSPKEDLKNGLNVALGGLETAYRTSPIAPILGATFGTIKSARRKENILEGARAGIVEQPGIGEALTDNPVAQTIIDIGFMAVLVSRPLIKKKLNSIKLKSNDIKKVSDTLGVSPSSSMEEISQAYKNKIIQYKDVFAGRGTSQQIAEAKKLNDAYNILKKANVFERKLAGLFGKVNLDDINTIDSKAITEVAGKVVPKTANIAPSVVQVVNQSTGEKTFYTVPKEQFEEVKTLIDGQNGIAGEVIDNKNWHITAKTPEQMTQQGFKEGGLITSDKIPKPVSQISPESKGIVKTEVKTPKLSEKDIENTNNIKDVKLTIKSIRKEFEDLKTEAEGLATVAQEQRSGLNVNDIAKLKRIYSRSQKFQEGDIETIRDSKWQTLVDKVVEDVQIKYPQMSEEEALDFALSLPTKTAETIKLSPNAKLLMEKSKKLDSYLKLLEKRQKDLKIEQDRELYDDWKSAMFAQSEAQRIITVPREQLPVGEGKEKVSRLEARITDQLDKSPQEVKDFLGDAVFNQMTKKENIAKASKYVTDNPEEALKVLTGEIESPKGILRNSIFVAMNNLAKGDVDLARRLASLFSTRSGQELSILTELDPNSPVKAMRDIIKIKEEAFKKRYGNRKPSEVKKKLASDAKKEVKKVSRSDWSKFLSEIQC